MYNSQEENKNKMVIEYTTLYIFGLGKWGSI